MSYYAKGAGHVIIYIPDPDTFEELDAKLEATSARAFIKNSENAPDIEVRQRLINEAAKAVPSPDNEMDLLIDNLMCLFSIEEIYVDYKRNTIDILGYFPMENWNDDAYRQALEDIRPYCVEGRIECSGDEDCYWRYIYEDGVWLEQNGHISYSQGVLLGDLLGLIDDNERVSIIMDDEIVSGYDGKNSIDTKYNNKEVLKMYTANSGTSEKPVLCIEIK